jgi:hypothetical protein
MRVEAVYKGIYLPLHLLPPRTGTPSSRVAEVCAPAYAARANNLHMHTHDWVFARLSTLFRIGCVPANQVVCPC